VPLDFLWTKTIKLTKKERQELKKTRIGVRLLRLKKEMAKIKKFSILGG